MAEATLKDVITLTGLGYFKEEADDAYVAQEEGKGLIETTKVTKLDGIEAGAQVNEITNENIETKVSGKGFAKTQDIANGYVAKESNKGLSTNDYDNAAKAIVDGISDTYLTKESAGSTYATQATVNALAEKANKIWHLAETDPVITKSQLATKAASATEGLAYIVSDDNNHMYVFLGKSVAGTTEGFYDIGGDYDLSGYLTTSEAGSTYQTKEDMSNYLTTNAAGSTYQTKEDMKNYVTNEAFSAAFEEATEDDIRGLFE